MKDLEKLFNEGETLYDFVAKNYWKMSKEELKDLFLNFNFATYKFVGEDNMKMLEKETVDEMKEGEI